jgi:hypothetical protein
MLEKQTIKNRTPIIPKKIMLRSCTIIWYRSKTPITIVTGNNNTSQDVFLPSKEDKAMVISDWNNGELDYWSNGFTINKRLITPSHLRIQ